jgi:hypothetical protein
MTVHQTQAYIMEATSRGLAFNLSELCSRARIDGFDTLSEDFKTAVNELIRQKYLNWTVDAMNGLVPGEKFSDWPESDLEIKVTKKRLPKSDEEIANYIISLAKYEFPRLHDQARLDGFSSINYQFNGVFWRLLAAGFITRTPDSGVAVGPNYEKWTGKSLY